MDSVKKIVNIIKFPKSLNISLNIEGSGLLHNKFVLYLIFIISFGNFMLELIGGDYYFVVIYILIGFLTTFFNKNMIIVLAMAAIFANILKYGPKSVEGMEDGDAVDYDIDEIDNNDSDLSDAIAIDISNKKHDNHDHSNDNKKQIKKSRSNKSMVDSDSDSDSESDSESYIESNSGKKRKNKRGEPFKDRLEMSDYEESEKLLKNQKLLLKNMKEIKPFFDTIQGLTSSFTGNKISEKVSK
jgi:hypothetical protein